MEFMKILNEGNEELSKQDLMDFVDTDIPLFYNEEKMIWKTTEVVSGIMEREKIPFELVFVQDRQKP